MKFLIEFKEGYVWVNGNKCQYPENVYSELGVNYNDCNNEIYIKRGNIEVSTSMSVDYITDFERDIKKIIEDVKRLKKEFEKKNVYKSLIIDL